MPRVLELCDDLAERFAFEPTRIAGYARVLREEGLLSTGARGRHAPDATPLDAARLIIAMMLRVRQQDAVEAVKLFGDLPISKDEPASIGGKTAATLGETFALLLQYCMQSYDDSDRSWQIFDRFDFSVSIVRDYCMGQVDIARLAEDGEEADESGFAEVRRFTFIHPELRDFDPLAEDATLPEGFKSAMRRYRAGFHETPILNKHDLIDLGQVLGGHAEPMRSGK